ncbi:MAG: hypothetical protein ISR65_04495 [Bacteriovoracaceae bacterium]|nr:hypothetical protein [Bacteriovoracaceae bacterium]
MAEESMEEELARLRAENEKLKTTKGKTKEITFKVSQKGAVSVYGMGRFPVTLYKEQWQRLLERKDDILSFIDENSDSLKTKD